ncbi:MAG: HEAT repeat domain-containing protein [Candidatus Omnitrophica bacterium]|nr:HEAT repeat domain-containing protein [Candidatus Omnitrophota bacterium]MCK6495734.1 HEAT repeat domain-containing protein [bacterium]NUP92398.1 HEAT repeat domain-containing protein [Candidatus Omnitrophota bacterium]
MPDIRDDQHPKIWSVLFSDDTEKRLTAIDILSKVDVEWPVAWFSLLLADSNQAVAAAAFSALKKRGKPVIPLLSLQRLSPLSRVRLGAVRVIGELGDMQAIQDIIAALFDPVVDVREEGRKSIEAILNRSLQVTSRDQSSQRTLDDLMRLFASLSSVAQRNVRSVMVSSLLVVAVENPKAFWALYPQIEAPGKNAIELEILSRPTPRRMDLLYQGLVSQDPAVAEKLLSLIERLLNKDSISDHVDSIQKQPPEKCRAVLEVLAARGVLATFFDYFHWIRRDQRVSFLRLFAGEFGEEYAPFFRTLLENPNPHLVPALIENFLTYEHELPYKIIQGLLRNPSGVVKRAAAHYLYYRGQYEAVRDLMPLLRDEDPETAKSVVNTLGRISRDYLIDNFSELSEKERLQLTHVMQRIDENFVDSLIDLLGGLDDEDRVNLTLLLADMARHPGASESIEELLEDASEKVRASAVRGMAQIPADQLDDENIRRLFEDPDPRVRANLIESLPLEKKQAWVEKIQEATHSPVPRERANAILALFDLGLSEAEIPLMQMLRHPDSWMRTSGLYVLGRVDTPHLMFKALELCSDPFPHVRVHALRAISNKGNADLARQITWALSDPVAEVREAAHLAIKNRMGLDYRS